MPTTQPRRRPDRSLSIRTPVTTAEPTGMSDRCEVLCVDDAKVAHVRRTAPAAATLVALAETFRALGDPTRLQIVTALAQAELCVCDLATLVGVSESAVSHSLRTLRQLRLVRVRKEGKMAYYTLDDSHVASLVAEGLGHIEEGSSRPA